MKKLFILSLALLLLVLCACAAPTESADENTQTEDTSTEADKNDEQVIYEDEYVKAVFNGVTINDLMPDNVYVNITFTNLTDDEITVLPMDSSINDTMVQFFSGMPATMQGGKTMTQSFFFAKGAAGLEDVEDISTIDMSFSVNDADFSELCQTDIVTITLP